MIERKRRSTAQPTWRAMNQSTTTTTTKVAERQWRCDRCGDWMSCDDGAFCWWSTGDDSERGPFKLVHRWCVDSLALSMRGLPKRERFCWEPLTRYVGE